MKFAVSRRKASGGCPSGAFGIGELVIPVAGPGGSGVKSALRGVISAMGKAMMMDSAGGVMRDLSAGMRRERKRRDREEEDVERKEEGDPKVCGGGGRGGVGIRTGLSVIPFPVGALSRST